MAQMKVTGLFAGVGGIERGLHEAGDFATDLLCEWWEPARAVLAERFDCPLAEIWPDVSTLASLPRSTDVLAAGFPCTDLSQAGRTAGIDGAASGLVQHVFRLLDDAAAVRRLPTWLVIENVPNLLQLDRGRGMRYLVDRLEALEMRWAYRVVDSRFTGVPQRRRRVLLVASSDQDPRQVLFADDAGDPPPETYRTDAYGFYSTEGKGGLGWAQDAVPTLKGGSTLGIPSPPAIWLPGAADGRRFVTPTIEDAEALQGFPRGWTQPAEEGRRRGPRWKLVGNAVTVPVARWLGGRLTAPGDWADDADLWNGERGWPPAAWGEHGKVWQVRISEFPLQTTFQHLTEVVDTTAAPALSHRAAAGFSARLHAGNLGRHPGFRDDVRAHVARTVGARERDSLSR